MLSACVDINTNNFITVRIVFIPTTSDVNQILLDMQLWVGSNRNGLSSRGRP